MDLNGNEIDGAFLTGHPGFPGFSNINASQTLAYLADMQESGVPVTGGYIADIHGNEHIPALSGTGGPCNGAPAALGTGSACYIAQAQYYNQAFGTFFQRLAADGITLAEHAVRPQLGRGRPRGRRERGPGDPAHAVQLRRRDRQRRHGDPGRALHLPDAARRYALLRGTVRQPDRAAGDREERHHPVLSGERLRRRSSGCPGSLGRTTPRSGHWNATPAGSPRRTRTRAPPSRSPTTSLTRPKWRSCTCRTPTRPGPRRSRCSGDRTTS